jgi:hypothetical protein
MIISGPGECANLHAWRSITKQNAKQPDQICLKRHPLLLGAALELSPPGVDRSE